MPNTCYMLHILAFTHIFLSFQMLHEIRRCIGVACAGHPSRNGKPIHKDGKSEDNKSVQSEKGEEERAGHRNIRF